MVVYAQERITAPVIVELEDILHAYYAATPAHEGIPPYDFDWGIYTGQQASGNLALFTARDVESMALLGVNIYFVLYHPHHKNHKVAVCDTLAVKHTERNQGIGSGLLRYSLMHVAEHGVHMVTHGYRTVYKTQPIFEKFGFDHIEQLYMLRIN